MRPPSIILMSCLFLGVFTISLADLCDDRNCNDNNACTDDTCNPASGCVYTPDDTNTCSDGSACSEPDYCLAGTCRSGPTVVCDDSNPCTDDHCNPASGCVFDNVPSRICRPANASCDVAERCTEMGAMGPACPPDVFAPVTTVCRPATDPCDVAENCSGTGPECPADEKVQAGATIVNADFEVDSWLPGTTTGLCPSGWHCNSNGASYAAVHSIVVSIPDPNGGGGFSWYIGPGASGPQFFSLNGANRYAPGAGHAFIEQTVSGFIPTASYQLSFSIASADPRGSSSIGLTLAGAVPGTSGPYAAPPAGGKFASMDEWETYSVNFKATACCVTFRFEHRAPPDQPSAQFLTSVALDNLTLTRLGSTSAKATGARTFVRDTDLAGYYNITDFKLAQSFTVKVPGELKGFDVVLQANRHGGGSVTTEHQFRWELRNLDGAGIPDSILDAGNFKLTALQANGPTPIHVGLHCGLPVEIGDRYAVSLYRLAPEGEFEWTYGTNEPCPATNTNPSPYSAGTAFIDSGSGFNEIAPTIDFRLVTDVYAPDSDADRVPDAIEALVGAQGMAVSGGDVSCAEVLADGTMHICLTDPVSGQHFTFNLPNGTSGGPVTLEILANPFRAQILNATLLTNTFKEVALPSTGGKIIISDVPGATAAELTTGTGSNVIAVPAPNTCTTPSALTPWIVRNNSSFGSLVVSRLSHTALGIFEDPDGDLLASSIDNCPTVHNPGQEDTNHNGIGDACSCQIVGCSALDACHDVGVCDPGNDVCSSPNRPSGTTCDDGDPCTQTDRCESGVCVGTGPVLCTASDQCHVAICDIETGLCVNLEAPDLGVCGDSDPCTFDACNRSAGQCVHQPIDCNDMDACTNDGCDPASGCFHTPVPSPAEVNNTVRVTESGTVATIRWTDAPGPFSVYRGSRMGSGWAYNQSCMIDVIFGGSGNDELVPASGTAFYYLVSRRSSCGESILGFDSTGAAIPNTSPCP